MGKHVRNELQQEVVDAILDSGAVNFEAIGTVLAKYGDRAARTGTDVAAVIGWRLMDLCIPVDPFNLRLERLGAQPQG
jgi:hypothetical protein